ncbi:MAG: cation diffusion facilitator family transporter [Gammaproteobacteria bacterium]|nr:cation diffusion facilitator family transporter [Gammaproteobacteria bacterium]MDH4310771.1 cation diffusion facilitator family transporter [Gammaproteobacteria bacterium]MDH5271835.1 cation diffusion facilitator family transporter [Gammaproteobacteria bacterium]
MADAHGSSARAILYAFLANFGIAITKTGAAIHTNSGSMLAEAIHSYADCANQALLFLGLKQAEKPATRDHPLGFGKATYFWSFVVALLLFSMGGLFSIYEGWHKLHAPEPLNRVWIALSVLAVAIVLETGSLLGALREIRKIRRGRRFGEWLEHTRNAELVVVLGEDIAALAGLVIAFVFLTLALVTGDTRWDAAGSIVIGTVLILVAAFIAVRIQSLLIGKSAEPRLEQNIRGIINRDPAIEELLNTITLQMGPKVVLAAKVKMRAGLSIEEAVAHLNELEVEIKQLHPEVGWCFVEPDVTD